MKIALIRPASSQVPGNSYNIQEIGLAKALTYYKIQSDIYLISDKKQEYSYEIIVNGIIVKIHRLTGIRIPGQQTIFYSLFEKLRKEKYDLIQVLEDSQITSVLVSIYCKRNNIPVVLWQGMYEDYKQIYKKFIQKVFDRMFLPILKRNVVCTICKTNHAKKYLESKGFENNFIASIGLDDSNFKKENVCDYDWYKHFNVPYTAKILLYVGRIEKRRNPEILLQLLNKLNEHHNDIYLIIVGKGPLLHKFMTVVNKLNLGEKVRHLMSIPQESLKGLYKIATCYLLPSKYEIFGMTVLESMYCGVPVISSNVAGPAHVIDNRVDGYLIDGFEIDKWCSTIEEIILDKKKRDFISKNATHKIREKYLWSQTVINYINIYKNIIQNWQ